MQIVVTLCIDKVPRVFPFLRREWLFSIIDRRIESMGGNSMAHRIIRDITDSTIRETNLFRKSFVDTIVVDSQKRMG